MPKLHILSPSSIATTIDLTERLITIGRTGENTIRIQDTNVSQRHGILVRDGDDYQLHDFKSTNGTFVNGEQIMAVKLKDGASIRLGSVELRYESVPASVAPLGIKSADEGLLHPSGGSSKTVSSKERGIAKRTKPEFAAGALHSGHPGITAKPIPPSSPKSSE